MYFNCFNVLRLCFAPRNRIFYGALQVHLIIYSYVRKCTFLVLPIWIFTVSITLTSFLLASTKTYINGLMMSISAAFHYQTVEFSDETVSMFQETSQTIKWKSLLVQSLLDIFHAFFYRHMTGVNCIVGLVVIFVEAKRSS